MSESIFDLSKYIDNVVYINLDKRTDRRLEIETQLKEYDITFERFAAIPHSNGIVGCGYSHLAVLSAAREREGKNILILEDDFVFAVSKEEFQRQIAELFDKDSLYNSSSGGLEYDVIMISYTKHGIQRKEELDHPIVNCLIEAQNASGYIVNSHYYSKLIELYETNIPLLEQTGQHWIYANDIIWKRLQCVDRWFYCKQRIGMQRAGFSDNTNGHADYEV